MTFFSSLISALLPAQTKKQAIYLDARTFDPDQARRQREAVIIKTCNEADTIFERVCQAMRTSAGVVVVDQGSTDGTPYFAAEAGAVVIFDSPGAAPEEAMHEAMRVARHFSQVAVIAD